LLKFRSTLFTVKTEVVGVWRRFNSEKLQNLCTWMKLVRHVACMGEVRNTYKILIRIPWGRHHEEDLDIEGG
jgi:hypothetical protein